MNIVVADARAIVSELDAQRRPNTHVLYIESPGSLLFEMLDIPALADYARKHKLILIADNTWGSGRSEEHTSELQSLMRISYAVLCLNKKTPHQHTPVSNTKTTRDKATSLITT